MLNGIRRKMIQRTIKLHTGVEKTLNSTKIITKKEWQKSAEKLYGSDAKQWRFKCPICGHTASVQEIMSAGAKDPNCAYMECIGRYQKDIGCNFAAYGFLGIPYGGYVMNYHLHFKEMEMVSIGAVVLRLKAGSRSFYPFYGNTFI